MKLTLLKCGDISLWICFLRIVVDKAYHGIAFGLHYLWR